MYKLFTTILAFWLAGSLVLAQEGSDIDDAIPLHLPADVFSGIGDSKTRRDFVFEVEAPAEVEFTITVTADKDNAFTAVLLTPDVPSLKDYYYYVLVWKPSQGKQVKIIYKTAIAGGYYLWVYFRKVSVDFTVSIEAAGVSLDTGETITLLPEGLITMIDYTAAGFAKEILIAGVLLCLTCDFKPPVRPQLVEKIEHAFYSTSQVQPGFDESGVLVKLTVFR
ncbi:hypothetical protein MYX75_05525 [Acidobacteria bacterium AH-259-A15]|nr:hypothetical protein [Acidobacteria bacterium AH-259-A15]